MVIVDECVNCGALKERGKWVSREKLLRNFGLEWYPARGGALSRECAAASGLVKENDPGLASLPRTCTKL